MQMIAQNPYDPPEHGAPASSGIFDRPSQQAFSRYESIILGIVTFAVVSCTGFAGLTFVFHSRSAAPATSFLFGAVAIVLGGLAGRYVTKSSAVRLIEPASLVAVLASGLFVLFVLLTDNPLVQTLLPSSVSRIHPGHFVLIALSVISSIFGFWGCVRAYASHRIMAAFVAGGCGAISTFYCVAVGIVLFINC